jgi:hypothetical protein
MPCSKIVGSLLYYTRAVDNKLLIALSAIAARQAKATIPTEQTVDLLLNYIATYPNDGIAYQASNMILCAHVDAGILNKTFSCSRAGAHIYLLEDSFSSIQQRHSIYCPNHQVQHGFGP